MFDDEEPEAFYRRPIFYIPIISLLLVAALAIVIIKPPSTFDVKNFLEGIREHWIFEIRDDPNLEIEVWLAKVDIDG